MSIGKKIKELRRAQDVTQEKLADYLNLSYQAVSKWENELAYPDITLVPALANFFGVSADELLGMKGNEDNEELTAYEKTYRKNENCGKISDNIELCRKVIEKYPRNFKWISKLAHSINFQKTSSHEEKEEIIALCERILEDCNDSSLRNCAIQLLVFNYCDVGNRARPLNLLLKCR